MGKGKGWHGEPQRHADAARGIKTAKNVVKPPKIMKPQNKALRIYGQYKRWVETVEFLEEVPDLLENVQNQDPEGACDTLIDYAIEKGFRAIDQTFEDIWRSTLLTAITPFILAS